MEYEGSKMQDFHTVLRALESAVASYRDCPCGQCMDAVASYASEIGLVVEAVHLEADAERMLDFDEATELGLDGTLRGL